MNFGMVLLAFMLLAGSILGIIMIAGANDVTYVDSFGNTSDTATNNTQAIVTNATAPLAGAGMGLILIIAVFIIFVAAVFVIKASYGNSSYNTRR